MSLDRNALLRSLEVSAQANDETAKSIRELLGTLRQHLQRDEERLGPILKVLQDAIVGRWDARGFGEKEFACATFIVKEYPRLCSEHRQIKKRISQVEKVAEREKHFDIVQLLESFSNNMITEEEILYPASRVLSEIIISSRYASGSDPCELTTGRQFEPTDYLFGIP